MQLEGKNAVITGGGRGIGAAVAEALAGAGAGVVVAARSHAEIDTVAEGIRRGGGTAHAVACDVTDPGSVGALHAAATQHLGSVSIVVNNAGIATSAPLKAVTLEQWNRVFAVNVTGTFLVTKAFLPDLVAAGWGRIINVASIAGKMGAPYISTYSASKHAVIGFTRSVALEVATTGVTVNAVCPGYVRTALVDAAVERISAATGLSNDKAIDSLEATSPQGRIYEPEEVAHVVLSLCAEAAGGINAQSIVLDGGAVQK